MNQTQFLAGSGGFDESGSGVLVGGEVVLRAMVGSSVGVEDGGGVTVTAIVGSGVCVNVGTAVGGGSLLFMISNDKS